MADLRTMFNPTTMALIGASDKKGSIGRTILENLLKGKTGRVFPVNPGRKKLLEVDTWPDVRSIPEHLDLAVIATPAPTVPAVVEECGLAGVTNVVVISSGFKEIGEEGRKLEGRIEEIRRRYDMRLLGPNCMGFARSSPGISATFLKGDPPPGNIAFLSQSGALGIAILDWAARAGVGFSMFASLGSMLDVDFGDVIDFLGSDESTKSILVYMEGIGTARRFMSAARAYSRHKPIIVLKPGRFAESARAARSHTGAMTGNDEVYEAAFKRAGVVRVKEISELFAAAKVLDSERLPRGPRLAIVTGAGGPGVMATDALMEEGGVLATLSDKSIEEIDAVLPPYWSKGNPVDVAGGTDIGRYVLALNVCLRDPAVDAVLVIYVLQETAPPAELAEAVTRIVKDEAKPVLTCWMGADEVEEARRVFARNNIPAYETPEEAIRTYLTMYRYKRNLDELYETPAELPLREAPEKEALRAMIGAVVKEGRVLLDEEESKRLLAGYGIPVTQPERALSAEAAVVAAERIGYPVVIKVLSSDISHKSDVGGVALGIDSPAALRDAYRSLVRTVRDRAPEAVIEGVTVQKMIREIDYELILGAKKDKDFGSVILFGLGGITAELMREFSIGLPPLNQVLAKMLMQETRAYAMLRGFRGKPPANLEELEEILVAFSNLIVDFPEIAEVDINPLAVAKGRPYALDARIVIDGDCATDQRAHYPHLVIKPYPSRYVSSWNLPDGTELLLRPIRPEDEPLEREMIASLSAETLRTRFFAPVKDISSHEWLSLFCNIDYDRHAAIVAELRENGKRSIIGVARLLMDADFHSGELAVLVVDRYQGMGLGKKLLEVLIGIGRDNGLDKIEGQTLTENARMIALARGVGFSVHFLSAGTSRLTLNVTAA
ncbi:MAG: bifunctional acetate--CoA ligase family protein/GNAT family N-acetyltransferase [Syntrophorhabdales bacterium]|jgi:acetyltransferase